MPVPLLDLRIQEPEMRYEIDRIFSQLIDTSTFIGGSEVKSFSQEFADYCGGGYCIPVANGTDALILALKALGIGPGDEVITSPFTFIATTEAITAVGAAIKFADIHPAHYTLDPVLVEKAVTRKTKAILPVHLFGQPADMDPLMDIARKNGLKVIEDAAQAHGAEYKGRRVGTLGDAACFSFYPTKNLGCFGDGGAVVSRSKDIIDKVTKLGDHGRSTQYFHDIEGFNSRLDALQAAVLRIKLRRLDRWNEERRLVATAYNQALQNHLYVSPPQIASYAKHVFHLYCVESPHRDELSAHLKESGIGNGVYYPLPLHLQPAYARLGHRRGDFPVSERLAERILALPMWPGLNENQTREVREQVAGFHLNPATRR